MTPREIRQAREDLGLTRAEFAAALGVTERTVLSWEYGSQKRHPSGAVLKQLQRLQEFEQMLRDIKATGGGGR